MSWTCVCKSVNVCVSSSQSHIVCRNCWFLFAFSLLSRLVSTAAEKKTFAPCCCSLVRKRSSRHQQIRYTHLPTIRSLYLTAHGLQNYISKYKINTTQTELRAHLRIDRYLQRCRQVCFISFESISSHSVRLLAAYVCGDDEEEATAAALEYY